MMKKMDRASSIKIKVPQHFSGSDVKKHAQDILRTSPGSQNAGFVFDFTGCQLVDSSAIGALISLSKECRSKGIRLILKNISNDLFKLFRDTGLEKIFTLEKNGVLKEAEIDLFEMSSGIQLCIKKELLDDICIFIMSGVMNYPCGSAYFKQQFLLALNQSRKIILEMEGLSSFDSLSISSVLGMNNLLKNTGGNLCICGANYIIKDMFLTLGINEIVPIFDNRQHALKNWNSKYV
ncbi:MAG TPA: STAS domain-containing protein [Chitinispirillaceae bacterium]|nr:STAS domain-containing protein [Chitinispirillaceae bacterium]